MGKINTGRVILGGLVTGVIANFIEDVLNGTYLAPQWRKAMASLDRPMIGMDRVIELNLTGFVLGITAIWIYAAIRPRFGAGPKTGVYAALATWAIGYFVADATPALMDMFPMRITAVLLGVGLVEIIVATLAGAYFYREAD
jgi:hypothetical protein